MLAERFDSFEALPESYRRLLEAVEQRNVLRGLRWYQNMAANATDPTDQLRLYGVSSEATSSTALALLVARVRGARSSILEPSRLEELSNFYSLEAGPVLSPTLQDEAEIEAVLDCLVGAICAERPRWDVLRLGPLNRPSPPFDALVRQLRRRHLAVEPFFQHGNWHEVLRHRSFDQYIKALGKSAKETVRKSRKLDREQDVEWTMTTGLDGLDRAMESYEKVYVASWKEPELYPRFVPELIRSCARNGCLRLGNLYVNGKPTATQLVILSGKDAVMFKTAYIPEGANYSCGAVVMLRMLQHLTAVDQIARFDFGAGDEPYKAQWSSQRGERWGLLAYNTRTARGLILIGAIRARALAARIRRVAPASGTGLAPN